MAPDSEVFTPSISPTQSLEDYARERQRAQSAKSILAVGIEGALSLFCNDEPDAIAKADRDLRAAEAASDEKSATRLRAEIPWLIERDKDSRDNTDRNVGYVTGVLKSGTLFLPGGSYTSRGATALIWGLDQAKTEGPFETRLLDFGLGGIKGLANQYLLGKISHSSSLSLAQKGMLIGITSRGLEAGISRETFLNRDTGETEVVAGLLKAGGSAFSGQSLLLDAAAFYTGGTLAKQLALPKNPLIASMSTGAAFGWSSGISAELARQGRSGHYSFGKVVSEGATHALLDSVAAAGGTLVGRAARQNVAAEVTSKKTAELADGKIQPLSAMAEPLERSAVPVKVPEQTTSQQMLEALRTRIGDGTVQLTDFAAHPEVRAAQPLAFQRTEVSLPQIKPEFRQALEGSSPRPEFSSLADFEQRAIQSKPVPVREYAVPGLETKIITPESYALRLERYAELRKQAVTLGPGSDAAIAELSKPEYQGLERRVTPEQLAIYLKTMPQPEFFKNVLLTGENNPYDLWYRGKHADAKFKTSAMDTVFDTKSTSLYGRSRDAVFTEDLLHEWSHLFERQSPIEAQMFKFAATAEGNAWPGPYAKEFSEGWAIVTGEYALHPNKQRAAEFALSAPIRAAVVGRAIEGLLNDLPANLRGTNHEAYVERARFLRNETSSIAQQRLQEIILRSPQTDAGHNAAKLLAYIGTPEQMASLSSGPRTMNFADEVVPNYVIERVARMPTVDEIILARTHINDDGIGPLADMALKSLNARSTGLSDSGVYSLPSSLEKLVLAGTGVTDGAVPALAERLPNLKFIDLSNTAVTQGGRRQLQTLLPATQIVH
jgi:hypothetical protein